MKQRVLAVLLAVTTTAFGQTVPKNLIVFAKPITDADTRNSKVGDYMLLRSTAPLKSDRRVLAPTGSVVIAHVSKSVPPGKDNCKPGELRIEFDAIELPSGDWALLKNAVWEEVYNEDGTPRTVTRKVKGTPFKEKLKTAALVPAAVVFAPFAIAMALAVSVDNAHSCHGQPGEHMGLFSGVPYQAKTSGKIDNRWRATAQKLVANMVKSEHQ